MALYPTDPAPVQLQPEQVQALLRYLDLLPPSTELLPTILPSPPLAFLMQHIDSLPPNLTSFFSAVLTPQARSKIPTIRNRRLEWASRNSPLALSAYSARERHPLLFERIVGGGVVPARPAAASLEAEEEWGQNGALPGGRAQHGNLGALLQAFEDEREGERRRDRKREERLRENEETEEFDSESDDEEDIVVDDGGQEGPDEELSEDERLQAFERLIKEKWLDGREVSLSFAHHLTALLCEANFWLSSRTLQSLPYDSVDFDETLDPSPNQGFSQDRWFDDEPEETSNDAPSSTLAEGEYDY